VGHMSNSTHISEYSYHNSGHYPSSCLIFRTQRSVYWIVSVFMWNLLRWAQYLELVSVSGLAFHLAHFMSQLMVPDTTAVCNESTSMREKSEFRIGGEAVRGTTKMLGGQK
jgi:hypothetical protein